MMRALVVELSVKCLVCYNRVWVAKAAWRMAQGVERAYMASPSLLVSEHEPVLDSQDGPLYEIVHGQRVDLPLISAYATWLASCLHGQLWPYAREKGLFQV